MPIRMIARELYRFLREVEKIEKQIESAPFEAQKDLMDRLRRVKAERDRIRGMLDAKKE